MCNVNCIQKSLIISGLIFALSIGVGFVLCIMYYRVSYTCVCTSLESGGSGKSVYPIKKCECGQGLNRQAECQTICPWNTTSVNNTCISLDYDSTVLGCGSQTSVFHMYPKVSQDDSTMPGIIILGFGVLVAIGMICAGFRTITLVLCSRCCDNTENQQVEFTELDKPRITRMMNRGHVDCS